MTSKNSDALTAAEVLFLFPRFVQLLLVDDDVFRVRLGLELNGTIRLGSDEPAFNRREYFAAIRGVYAGLDEASLTDAEDKVWSLRVGTDELRTTLLVAHETTTYKVLAPLGLKAGAGERDADFDRALDRAGLGRDAFGDWRERLSAGPLADEQVPNLRADLESTPVSFAHRMGTEALRTISIDDLVSSERAYFERLGGAGVAVDVLQLGREITDPHIRSLIAWNALEGAKMALLLGTHSTVVADGPLAHLPDDTLVALADWVVEHGDLISRIAFLELGLAALVRVPDLESRLLALADDLLALDPADKSGPLHLLSRLVALVDGQLSVSKILSDYPPFHRRHLALAQAALIERGWGRGNNAEGFGDWALSVRGAEFYLQTLVDMRVEPRWQADFIAPRQLKNEFLGRLQNAVGTMSERPSAGPLFDRLLGDGSDALPAVLQFPAAFLPGPLEGSVPKEARQMPASLATALDKSLEADKIEVVALASIINLRGVFHIAEDKIERAVELIRENGHRTPPDAEPEIVENLLSGLADVAAATRNQDLANELRIMARRRRRESRDPNAALQSEFNMAMTAAAAWEDLAGWCQFIGDWVGEIAFATTDRRHADDLANRLDRLCLKAPVLRGVLGRHIVALKSFALS